ncbi:HetP family heterocyst commitment protein [Nostocaceae cyanobacterium CENA357]|uniref:HetP family heterocyst commitment protein n=1 Tax=Atlanticothrix silvestris CENA357 TaxID=1725252 RepID=A0A8J7L4C1_9CYAN|nr:HetP family heterocyst commitment protein [Atlanticothrix silvestris]MBH8553472.1 HetP family heterocyst commitment protein [Atlanticothrix silvestris CENA357]
MNQDISSINSNFNKKINPEQLDQIVEAILAGKYSWACVLILRLAGYNPLHYIPYRTYNRLLKENSQLNRVHEQDQERKKVTQTSPDKRSDTNVAASCLGKIKDLAYLEVVGKQKTEIRGGLDKWLTKQVNESQSVKPESQPESTQDLSLKPCEINETIS